MNSARTFLHLRTRFRSGLIATVIGATTLEVQAIPFYARSRGLACVDCHSGTPKLNLQGEEFLARGYRRSGTSPPVSGEFPISIWITGRHEDRSPGTIEKTYVPKVELMSGGPLPNP